ncbi:MAG TPA: hypothetical protein VK338_04175 [Candidatus Nitrosocosmicus sp.]|nr:hypothetical protein [Candidatus Nitrosocosmicus sp.]
MKDKKTYIKILIALVFAYFIGSFVNNEIFIADSPTVRPNLRGHFIAKIDSFAEKRAPFLAKWIYNFKTSEEKLANTPFTVLTKGVYAKSATNIAYIEYKKDEIDWLEYTFIVKGKEVKINVPKGQNPPSQEIVENFHK